MDYDGNELPEEIPAERPPQNKVTTVIKKILKYTFITIVTAVWVFILLSIFLRRDDAILETPILSDKARSIFSENKDDFPVYVVHTKENINYDGSFQLKSSVYAEKANELELGLRIAWTQLRYCEECGRLYTTEQLDNQKADDKPDKGILMSCEAKGHHVVRAPESDRGIVWSLTDSDGNKYDAVNEESRTKNLNFGFFKIKYEYIRICYDKVYFDIANNIINTAGKEVTDTGKGTLYYFRIYDKVTGDTLFSTCLYDNETYIEETEYKLPDKDYIS